MRIINLSILLNSEEEIDKKIRKDYSKDIT